MIEFMIIFGAIMFFFVIFFLAIQVSTESKVMEQKTSIANELALVVKTEIDLAHEASEGYQRQFFVPSTLFGSEYTINITDFGVYVEANKIGIAYPLLPIQGNINKGWNNITKINGTVLLNQ